MKLKHKIYIRLNLTAIVFIVVSFISVTLAWFAYTGLSEVNTDISVKAWYIELKKDGVPVSSDIDINLADIYPGMETVYETVNISNKGDSDAQVNYSIVSAKILDEDNFIVNDSNISSLLVEDSLSHNYPFHINISLSKNYAVAKNGESVFTVSVSWPLDSGNDSSDSYWGKKAYDFQTEHKNGEKSIQIKISLTAEQYIEEENSKDIRFPLGKEIYYDVVLNKACSDFDTNNNCIKTHIIDTNNKVSDTKVTLFPEPNFSYLSKNMIGNYNSYNNIFLDVVNDWTVDTRNLTNKDILKIISTNITDSYFVRDNLSDSIIGNLTYGNRLDTEIEKIINSNGNNTFNPNNFPYLNSNTCYWTVSNYGNDRIFAIKPLTSEKYILYGEESINQCKIIPVIEVNKLKFD